MVKYGVPSPRPPGYKLPNDSRSGCAGPALLLVIVLILLFWLLFT